MADKTRVLFVIPSLLRAGAQTQLVELVNGLAADRFERHVYTFERRIDLADRLSPDVHFYNRPRSSRFDLRPAREMARIIDRKGVDVVHCTMQFAFLQGWIAALVSHRRPPVIDALHTTINRDRKDELLDRFVYRWLMRRASAIICVCETQARVWIEKFPFLQQKVHTVHNGIDCMHFDPDSSVASGRALRERLGILPGAVVIASVAAFRPEKGHRLLLQAMQELVRVNEQTHLLLAGDGALRDSVEQEVAARDLARNVHFLGSLADVRPVLSASNLSVIASTAVETFSMAMLESLAMKVPVVTTDIGGAAEAVINRVTGRVVPVGDPDALRDALLELVNDPVAREAMGVRGRALVSSHFTGKIMVEKTAAVLQDVTSKGGPAGISMNRSGVDPRDDAIEGASRGE